MAKIKSNSHVAEVFKILNAEYPNARTELEYKNHFELLVAVILSAQCTDKRVNLITPQLFSEFPTPEKMAQAEPSQVERLIHSCGFFRAKAKNVILTSKRLCTHFYGQVPSTIDELVTLPGVGRKTASVILNQAFSLPAIAVDTHVKRVSHRLGWAKHPHPDKIEWELKKIVPEKLWSSVNSLLIFHGRRICHARKPQCEKCFIQSQCKFYKTKKGKNA